MRYVGLIYVLCLRGQKSPNNVFKVNSNDTIHSVLIMLTSRVKAGTEDNSE